MSNDSESKENRKSKRIKAEQRVNEMLLSGVDLERHWREKNNKRKGKE